MPGFGTCDGGVVTWALPYPGLNSAFDALLSPGLQHCWKANFVTESTDETIRAHLQHGPKVPVVNSTTGTFPIDLNQTWMSG